MQKVRAKPDLKYASEDVVLVETINKVFRRSNGEWIEKKYFTTNEVVAELDIPLGTLLTWIYRRNIGNLKQGRFTFGDIKRLSKIKNFRDAGLSFKEIRNLTAGTRSKRVPD